MIIRYSPSLLGILICTLGAVQPARAIWPFPSRSAASTVEALVDVGSLGLEDEQGRVVAVGDWNGDQQSDLFVVSRSERVLQVYLWDKASKKYTPGPQHTSQRNIKNVVPADWNHDGRLDVLVVTEGQKHGWWGGGSDVLEMQVLLQGSDGAFGEAWDVPTSSASQPVVFDADGSLRPSMLGYPHTDSEDATDIQIWTNNGDGITLRSASLINPEQACRLANPHSSAFVDIDGDCVPDLVLHCQGDTASTSAIQIWLNRGAAGYELSRTYALPRGAGPLAFADMNRDGAIDIIFPVCSHHSTSSGIGSDCSINIAYNKQAPLCSGEATTMNGDGSIKCRGWGELCVPDAGYEFSFSSQEPYYFSHPLSSFFPSTASASSILLSVPDTEHIPLPLRAGDYTQDGFPDLLLTIVNSTAQPGIGFGSRQGTQVKVLENVRCAKGLAGCEDGQGQGRTFKLGHGKGYEAIEGMWDVQGASWLDVNDDGTLDIMVQRSGDQGEVRVTFVRNGFYHDAFFLRAQVLNGACDGPYRPEDGSKAYSGAGASAIGASYKFTVLDTLGRRGAQQIPQIPQTGYHALGLPYSFIGLGRTNNYIERLSVGVSLHSSNTTSLDSIIPNSQLLITPPSAPPSPQAGNGQDQIDGSAMREWHTELFLQPGQWVPWVGLSVVGTVLALGGVVWFLHEREKSEDELERRRALHAINFQAL